MFFEVQLKLFFVSVIVSLVDNLPLSTAAEPRLFMPLWQHQSRPRHSERWPLTVADSNCSSNTHTSFALLGFNKLCFLALCQHELLSRPLPGQLSAHLLAAGEESRAKALHSRVSSVCDLCAQRGLDVCQQCQLPSACVCTSATPHTCTPKAFIPLPLCIQGALCKLRLLGGWLLLAHLNKPRLVLQQEGGCGSPWQFIYSDT